jgi:glycine oxidase
MLALEGAPVRHVVYAPGVYLVPRDRVTLAGATMERVGFDAGTTDQALDTMHAATLEVVPALSGARRTRAWSGLRPVTPDFLPIIDRDPVHPALIYACGHSRNGILLAPLTGESVADLALDREPTHDLTPFKLQRFAPEQ